MTVSKRICCFALALMALCWLCACDASMDDITGAWSGSCTYKGDSFTQKLSLNLDGTYQKLVYKNGSYNGTEKGTYELNGKTVTLNPYDKTEGHTDYEYKNGALLNGYYKLHKEQ